MIYQETFQSLIDTLNSNITNAYYALGAWSQSGEVSFAYCSPEYREVYEFDDHQQAYDFLKSEISFVD